LASVQKMFKKCVLLLFTSGCKNAVRFGFYPYPKEPWHWEYNPPM
jgi:hypothetical protein